MGLKSPFECIRKIVKEMPAIGNLDCSRSTTCCSLGVGTAAVTANNLNPWVCMQPSTHTGSRAIGEQVNWAMGFEIDQDCSIGLASPARPVVDAQHSRRCRRRQWSATNQAKKSWSTGGHPQAVEEASTAFATHGKGNHTQDLGEPVCASGVWRSELGQTFGKNALRTSGLLAGELSDGELEFDDHPAPGQIGERALVAAANPLSRVVATWTRGRRQRTRQRNSNGGLGNMNMIQLEASNLGHQGTSETIRRFFHTSCCTSKPSSRLHQMCG